MNVLSLGLLALAIVLLAGHFIDIKKHNNNG
jgi:hypothetical protein